MVEYILHLNQDLTSRGGIGGARVNDVSIVNKGKSKEVEDVLCNGHSSGVSIAQRFHGCRNH